MEYFFSFFQSFLFWKTDVRKIIPDFHYPDMKAAILTYENEEQAKLSAFKVSKVLCRTNLTLYDGNTLFLYCRQMDLQCDPRSRNVTISGLDTTVPKDMYLDLLKVFGTLTYFEFCLEGDIPKAVFEFSRVTSAFAAVLSLQGTLSKDALVTQDCPLFPLLPISCGYRRNRTNAPFEIPHQFQTPKHLPPTDEIREQYFMLCSMNTQTTHTNYYDAEDCYPRYIEDIDNIKGTIEECSMGTVSFEFSRKRMRERGFSKRLTKAMFENVDKMNEENRRIFLQAAKRKILSYCL
ncbi:uncharacterized protein CDAR_393231 [Caerostris darwini]|uniref:RRM domain-containing protein n=1 Tax=Caerostris darwini TaxID=1538125 RepID=A0AAV4V0L7_9ARAC|nr:uncharacterized protein CDAR_393231 [Caerostris darwini]